MGPTGTPTETPAGETVLLVGGGLGNAVLFSIGAALRAARLARPLFRRLQEDRRSLQGRRYRARRRYASSGAATRRPVSRRDGRGTWPLSAISSRRSRPMARGRSARSTSRSSEVDRIIAIGSDGMMNAVAEARRAALKPLFPPGPSRDRVDQLADAMHDEGDLRAVPAAPLRPGERHRNGRVLVLQPGPGHGPRRFPGTCASACRRTARRRS